MVLRGARTVQRLSGTAFGDLTESRSGAISHINLDEEGSQVSPVREIRTPGLTRRGLETEPRGLLPGPERGNPGDRQAVTYGPPRQSSTLLIGGLSGNVAMVGMRTRPAIERAGTVTPRLQLGAPEFYPDPTPWFRMQVSRGVYGPAF